MSKFREFKKRLGLTLFFTFVVFTIMFLTIAIAFAGMICLYRLGIIDENKSKHFPLFAFSIISLVIGIIVTIFGSHRPLRPFREIMDAFEKIAKGDYSARINLHGPVEFKHLNKSFNNMAEELASIEILRSDFINNFSHEFKTPIVSIRGFAKILKRDDLSVDERNEYLDIIISESERLTELASNVLNLSKIEQQTILTNKVHFNVSEQIRLVIAMLDLRWSDKHIDIFFDNNEFYVDGNKELLNQVWINILDNAIKFSPDYGSVDINIKSIGNNISITISDQGCGIDTDKINHIFDKFYQCETSHTQKGYGLGLSIAHKILVLHDGTISVKESNKNGTTFEIILPSCIIEH